MRGATAGSGRALAEIPSTTSAPPALEAWRDLRVRLISACVLAPLGLACLIHGGWVFVVLVLLVMAGLGAEWAGLVRVRRMSPAGAMLLLWPGLSLICAVSVDWLAGVRLLLGGFLLGAFRGGGVVLIGLAGLALVWLRVMTGAGIASLLFVVLVVWSSDSLAYLVGRALGGARLAPRISPGKTRAGALGGFAGAMLAGAVVAWFCPGTPPWGGLAERLLPGALFGALLGVAAQSGDLAESALKRHVGVKDSGRLIPGHGGLLDRLDGLLAAAPLAALLSLGCGPGQPFWQIAAPYAGHRDIVAGHMRQGWLEGVFAAPGKEPQR